jgi:L-threonylcarbamoyladenylate synthase
MSGIELATPEAIARAAIRLREGDLVAFPTETVYGLGADAGNRIAVARIFAAKGRPADHPVIVHLPDATHLDRWARQVPAGARRLADRFWPGPLTIILPRAADVDPGVTGGQDSVGLRVPAHPVAHALLEAFAGAGGSGVAAPSANRFGHVSPTTAQHVADDLGTDLTILDGGACPVGIESTVVAFTAASPLLLRPGAIGLREIADVLGEAPRAPDVSAPRASGSLPSHYAPRTAAHLVHPDQLQAEIALHLARDEAVVVLGRTRKPPPSFDGTWIAAPQDARDYARMLYANLRALDGAGADAILIEAPPEGPEWQAVGDRLARATRRDQGDQTLDEP